MTEKDLWKTTRHDPIACPACGFDKMNASTKIADDGTGGGPEPGSFTVCANCGEFLRYGEGLVLEKAEIPDDISEKQRRTILLAQKFFRERGGVR
jgi:hypothetical protein